MGPEQAEWYFSVVTAQNARTLPHLVTVAVENAAALAEGTEDTEGDKGEAYGCLLYTSLLSLGVDTERYLLQFSYLWETDYTLSQVSRCRRNRAPTAGEQTIFFVPLEPSVCEAFLRQAAFEPVSYTHLDVYKRQAEKHL